MNLNSRLQVFLSSVVLSCEAGAIVLVWLMWIVFPGLFQSAGAWLMNQPEYIRYGVFGLLAASFYFCFEARKQALNPVEDDALKSLYEWESYPSLKFALNAGTLGCGLCFIAYAIFLYAISSPSNFMAATVSILLYSAITCISVIAAAQRVKEYLVMHRAY